jgi:hypothetical protein
VLFKGKNYRFICATLWAAIPVSEFDKMQKIDLLTYLTIDEKRRLAGFSDYEPGATPATILYTDSGKVPVDILTDG